MFAPGRAIVKISIFCELAWEDYVHARTAQLSWSRWGRATFGVAECNTFGNYSKWFVLHEPTVVDNFETTVQPSGYMKRSKLRKHSKAIA